MYRFKGWKNTGGIETITRERRPSWGRGWGGVFTISHPKAVDIPSAQWLWKQVRRAVKSGGAEEPGGLQSMGSLRVGHD